MSNYDIEHNITPATKTPSTTRRPDLSTFYSTISETYGDTPTTNPNAVPTPGGVVASYRLLADVFQIMLADHGGENELLEGMIESLDLGAAAPPREREGVPEGFLDGLERVGRGELKRMGKEEVCPICSEPFLDDEYPLVVRLPCHPDHKFDLECIRPWLKLNATCPLDRKELLKKKEPPPKDEEEDEEYDTFYA